MYECKLAERLAELRAHSGATQEDVAQSLSVSNKTISKWETGVSMPDLPMLVELAKYYGVTTDALLGLSEGKKQNTKAQMRAMLEGLDHREAVLKAFEVSRTLIQAMCRCGGSKTDCHDVVPQSTERYCRSQISLADFFSFSASSDEVNLAVMLLRNRADLAWLGQPEKQKRIARLFKFLSDEDTLTVMYFIHSKTCSDSFTADYVAAATGLDESRVTEILEEFRAVNGECRRVTAQLSEGEVGVYDCGGDGIILTLISLAFEKVCGQKIYDYNYSSSCKMIGGKHDELIG